MSRIGGGVLRFENRFHAGKVAHEVAAHDAHKDVGVFRIQAFLVGVLEHAEHVVCDELAMVQDFTWVTRFVHIESALGPDVWVVHHGYGVWG